jgi:hypothetical protein
VRLWAEYLEQSPPAWRGEIEHVDSKEVMHFAGLREMNDRIRRCIAMQPRTNKKEKE